MHGLHASACGSWRACGIDRGMTSLENKTTNAESLSLDHMRSFLAVVETGTQLRAASQLNTEQTTISRHIKRVQEHFGGGLFEAGASGRLSTRGFIVEQAFRAAMTELSRTRERLAVDQPVLRIGLIRPIRPLLEKALREQADVPDIPRFDVRLLEMGPEAQARALTRRELDIAISYAIPELATRTDIEESLITEEPFALVIPERAWVRGKPSIDILGSLLYAHSPRRRSSRLAEVAEQWLNDNGVAPKRSIECEWGSEILAYAGSGYGFGFLPALWSMGFHEGTVFAPVPEFQATAKVAAYTLQHVTPWVTRLRENLSEGARAALREFRGK
jgi:DNA-binding transcriptional LysR family regulator